MFISYALGTAMGFYFARAKIKNIIGDLFYGMTDANQKQVTLYTGTGGMREFDEALTKPHEPSSR